MKYSVIEEFSGEICLIKKTITVYSGEKDKKSKTYKVVDFKIMQDQTNSPDEKWLIEDPENGQFNSLDEAKLAFELL